ncbi:PTS sugar transporter subunit IIA [Irregularibacter muris]|uniref:Ascorbate-specific PTS system EIIA component n=1 Tax=Irregularibacter muris TaxID=1796619 RepID=A0AAE3KZH6_9FIRM|nr:PTS sugar transporter subunit IIA [Irregularibacter muris]MCR1898307.1 PTS sugar transporter subunit IIA [Irregularibacter muris]
MIKDLLTKESIELNTEVENWEEAIRKGGQLLLKIGAITEEYIEAMINTVKELGPYIVITEGVALPHARPERGALKMGMSLLTLKNPINFGSEDNDPVKLVVSFSSGDDKSHLGFLSRWVEILDDQETIEKIIQAKDKEEVINILRAFDI